MRSSIETFKGITGIKMNRFSSAIFRHYLFAVVFILVTFNFSISYCQPSEPVRLTKDFDLGWKFFKGDPKGAEMRAFDDSKWKNVELPNDWSILGPFSKNNPSCQAYLPGGIGWYRKTFDMANEYRGRKVIIKFDGVYEDSKVWINGHYLGERPYGYIGFRYNLTPYLEYGKSENVIAVRVNHSQDADSRWYSGSGINRNVWLIITNKIHVKQWGTFITTPQVSQASATVEAETYVRNETDKPETLDLTTAILDENKHVVTEVQTSHEVSGKGGFNFTQSLKVSHPQLWSPWSPYMYTAVNHLMQNGKVVDEYTTPFGIRTIRFSADSGFFINGKHIKLKGVCMHEDAGSISGSAVPLSVWRLRFRLLKEMGVNAIRTSHNPPGPEYLNLCDRMGFVVMEEAFDEWALGKKKWLKGWNVGKSDLSKGLGTYYDLYGYHKHFEKWGVKDLSDMIIQDRNRPSVILWSIGNEIDSPNDPYADPNDPYYESWKPSAEEIVPIAEKLVKTVKELDTTRPVTAALADIPQSDTTGFANLFRVVGYNYMEAYYKRDHALYPHRVIFASENGQSFQEWAAVRDHPYVAGEFLWTGVDYLGEAGKYPDRCNGDGLIDLAGFRKPLYYFRQSLWTHKPVVHITVVKRDTTGPRFELVDSWNWEMGKEVRVVCFTNARKAKLFLNGESLGTKERVAQSAPVLSWQVKYEPGVLKVVTDNGAKTVATDELRTAGSAYKIVTLPVESTINAHAGNVALVKVLVEDNEGNRVPYADNLLKFAVEGAGKILGSENGNDYDVKIYPSNERNAYQGRCMVAVESNGVPGIITLSAMSGKLKKAVAVIRVR